MSAHCVQRSENENTHHENLRIIDIEMYQVFKSITSQIIKDIFPFRDAMLYQLRKQTDFQIPCVHSAANGTKSIKFLGKNLGNFTS